MEEVQQEQPAEVRGDRQGLSHNDFRVEIEYDSDKGIIWLGHKKSKHGSAESVALVKDGDDFVLDVSVNLMLESEWILESRYRFSLRRVSVSDAEVDDLRTQLQRARGGIQELETLSQKLEDESRRLQAASQDASAELTQLRTSVENAKGSMQKFREANQRLQTKIETLTADITLLHATTEQWSEASQDAQTRVSEALLP